MNSQQNQNQRAQNDQYGHDKKTGEQGRVGNNVHKDEPVAKKTPDASKERTGGMRNEPTSSPRKAS